MGEYREQNKGDESPNFFEQLLSTHSDTVLSNMRVALPGVLETFDESQQTASIYPAIKQEIEQLNGIIKKQTLPLIENVPVIFPRSGEYAITFPLNKGDTGLLVFSDRCIDNFVIEGNIQNQAIKRMHDLSDAMFIPGLVGIRQALPAFNTSAIEIRNKSGDTVIRLEDGNINIEAGNVNLTAGAVIIDAGGPFGSFNLGQHVHISGNPGQPTEGPQNPV